MQDGTQGISRIFGRGALCMYACAAIVGCAPGELARELDPTEGVELAAQAAVRPPNHPIPGNNKVGAVVTCTRTELRFDPGGALIPESPLHQGRLLLVQRAPGLLRGPDGAGYLWADPDLYGVRSVEDRARFTTLTGHPGPFSAYWEEHVRAHSAEAAPPTELRRRGWVPAACLRPAHGADLPGEAHPAAYRAGNGAAARHPLGDPLPYRVVAGCEIPAGATYANSGGAAVSYRSYGTSNLPARDALYLLYNTPGACADERTAAACRVSIGGGGMTAGFVRAGVTFVAHYAWRDVNAWSVADALWYYGQRVGEGAGLGWGWLWAGCLMPEGTGHAAPYIGEPSGTGPLCHVRCCDGTVSVMPARDAAGCRDLYGACAGRGKVQRMRYQPAGGSATLIYERTGGCG